MKTTIPSSVTSAPAYHTTFRLGGELSVNRLGFGAMRLSGQPGNFGPYRDWAGGIRLLRRAAEIGVNFFDSARAYGMGYNKRLLAEALAPFGDTVVIATKGGIQKSAPGRIAPDASPAALRADVDHSLRELRRERIDLYYLHRPDPTRPWEEQVATLATLRAEGKIRHVGLSNVTLAQLQIAHDIVPIAAVQERYSATDRSADALLDYATRHGIAFVPYGPLDAKPYDATAPLAQAESRLASLAAWLGATPAQVALAWLLHRAPNVLPIPGTTSLEHLEENQVAADLFLRPRELALIAEELR
jgi:pyridoxine 4-dehydrogenase